MPTTNLVTQGFVDQVIPALSDAGIPVRAGWAPVRVRDEHHDERPVTVIRFQPAGYCLGGAHLSVVVDSSDTLLGCTCLTLQRPGVLPSPAAARDIAWDAGAGRRATQMWLHDAWVCAHDGLGPQPDPPYARV